MGKDVIDVHILYTKSYVNIVPVLTTSIHSNNGINRSSILSRDKRKCFQRIKKQQK